MSASLLIEVLVEELPPKALGKLGQAFVGLLEEDLRAAKLLAADSNVRGFATPRRLGVLITQVAEIGPNQTVVHRLVPVNIGLDAAGKPTPTLLKKLQSLGVGSDPLPALLRQNDGKRETLALEVVEPGRKLEAVVQAALDRLPAALPIPKVMSYQLSDGWKTTHFVRPVRGLVALHGSNLLDVSFLGSNATRTTLGHRFEAKVKPISIASADEYEQQLEQLGAVTAQYATRRAVIEQQLTAAAQRLGDLQVVDSPALLDEVVGLVECPNVLVGEFPKKFLDVPQECLILTMQANQKYFPLLDAAKRLSNQFLIVANIRPADPKQVVHGNERVVQARLRDAQFFFEQDRKRSLESRIPQLASIVYHNRLGSQHERMERVRKLAGQIAQRLGSGVTVSDVELAAGLAKTDLVTEMVGEFPELQGTMGRYYALHDGLSAEIADAIEDHYRPRFAGDSLPRNKVGVVLALADKLETLVGLFGIGQVPTGEKDPFALRRQALGVIRILIEQSLALDLADLLAVAIASFGTTIEDPRDSLLEFFRDRLVAKLRDAGFSAAEVECVLAASSWDLADLIRRLDAVREFGKLPESGSLAAANKRVANILSKNQAAKHNAQVNPELFQLESEQGLFNTLRVVATVADANYERRDYTRSLLELAKLKNSIDSFFEHVLVNAEDEKVRANRYALLASLRKAMNRVGDLSRLSQ